MHIKLLIMVNLGEGTFSACNLEVLRLFKFSKYVHELLYVFVFRINRNYAGGVIMDCFSSFYL